MDQITHRIAAVRESSTRRSRYGIAGFTAEVLVDNRAMRHVFHKSGLEVQSKLDGGVYSLTMDLSSLDAKNKPRRKKEGVAKAPPLSRTPTGCRCIDQLIDNMAKSPHTCESLLEVRMAGKSKDVFRQQARVLKVLANESRLKIIDRLSRGECSVGELTDLIGSDPSTISKHLAVLRAHDIVLDRREGNVVYYTLLTPCVMKFFACATQVLKERA